jgi:hypothetical protein
MRRSRFKLPRKLKKLLKIKYLSDKDPAWNTKDLTILGLDWRVRHGIGSYELGKK